MGDSVAVAADGIVQSVVDSEETKTTVTVGLGDGYEATYGLLDGVNVNPVIVYTKDSILEQ